MRSLPPEFITQINSMLPNEAEAFIQAIDDEPVTSVRINPNKSSDAFSTEPSVEWCENGRYLYERPSFIADPLFHAGAYYVQESSSMFLKQVIKQVMSAYDRPVRLLDLCAAPGGKSTLLLDQMRDNDLL